MPQIAEIYCSVVEDLTTPLKLAQAETCPITQSACDGGGNRYSSNLQIPSSPLSAHLRHKKEICSAVCSIDTAGKTQSENWIVCPRRLLCFDRNDAEDPQRHLKAQLFNWSALAGKHVAVWKEVKLKFEESESSVDYTFDYVISETDRIGKPVGSPVIIEVMTSSTSGGNKRKRTTVSMAFEDCLMGRDHKAPGINYRQVWGRMISQFFVKSQLAAEWKGKTFWVIQDSLLNYIQKSTAFNKDLFYRNEASVINLVACGFGDSSSRPAMEAVRIDLYAGEMELAENNFVSILGASAVPPLALLHTLLGAKPPIARFDVPSQ